MDISNTVRTDQKVTVRVVEALVGHRDVRAVVVDRHAVLERRVAGAADGLDARDEVELLALVWERHGAPAHLLRRGRRLGKVVLEELVRHLRVLFVHDRRQDAVEPAALVLVARQRERCARELLGVEAVGALLRVILRLGQRTGQRLGAEVAAKTRLVRQLLPHAARDARLLGGRCAVLGAVRAHGAAAGGVCCV